MLKFTQFYNFERALAKITTFKNCSSSYRCFWGSFSYKFFSNEKKSILQEMVRILANKVNAIKNYKESFPEKHVWMKSICEWIQFPVSFQAPLCPWFTKLNSFTDIFQEIYGSNDINISTCSRRRATSSNSWKLSVNASWLNWLFESTA